MEKQITRIIVERKGSTILSRSFPSPVSREDIRRTFLSLHLSRVFTIDVTAPVALVTIL